MGDQLSSCAVIVVGQGIVYARTQDRSEFVFPQKHCEPLDVAVLESQSFKRRCSRLLRGEERQHDQALQIQEGGVSACVCARVW